MTSAQDWLRPRLPPDRIVTSNVAPMFDATKLAAALARPADDCVLLKAWRASAPMIESAEGMITDTAVVSPGSPRGVNASWTKREMFAGIEVGSATMAGAAISRLPTGIVRPNESDWPDSTLKLSGRPSGP